MTIPIFVIDAFADQPFAGNPAAVCLLESEADATWMQNVAREMNLSETAFVCPEGDGMRLRWFTPGVEVDLCGHATIATASILKTLKEEGGLPPAYGSLVTSDTCSFETRSGTITTIVDGDDVTLNFPALPLSEKSVPEELAAALQCDRSEIVSCGQSRFDWLIRLTDAAAVRNLQPLMDALSKFEARGIIVTALADNCNYDFVSRFFAPAAGVNEDPVTGSAHCVLAPYWADQFGRTTLFGYQASSRGGHVKMELQEDRVLLTGKAVLVLRGTLNC